MSLYGGIKFSSAPGSSSSQLQRSLDSETTKSAPSPASASAPGPSSISVATTSQDAHSSGSTSRSAPAPAATGGFSAALKFAPRIRQPKAVSAPRSAPTYSASATVIESQPVLLQSKNDEVVMGADGRPLAAAPSMTLKDKTKDVPAAKRNRDGDATKKKKKKKKKRFEMPSMVVSTFDPDEPYDPNRPNDLGEYRAYRKRLREEKRAKALAERERRARGESSESGSSYYTSSEEEAPRRDAPKMFAPPKIYSPPRAAASRPPAQAQPAKRDESGEDAYARRAALAQAATGDDAYARRVAMSQAATGDDAYARRAAMSVRPPSDPQPPPPPPPAAMPDFPPPPPPAPTFRPPFVPPPANALAGAPPPPPPPSSMFVPPPFAALAGAPRPPPSISFAPQSPAPGAALSDVSHGSRSLPEPPTQSSSSHQQPDASSEEFDRMLAERKAAAAAIAAKFAALTSKPALPSLDEVEGNTWAEKHLRRLGHKEGEMLGTSGSGIIHALSTEHVVAPPKPTDPAQPLSKRQLAKQRAAAANAKNQNRRWVQHATNRGRIVNANEDERIKEEKDRVGEASRIVCLVGVVDSVDDVDEDLTGEIGEECSKYGIVERVLLHVVEPPPEEASEGLRVFVVFSGMAGAWRAIKELDGRFFGGKKIRARYFDESKFDRNDRDGELA